jgi:hypothetical protein
MGEPTGSGSRRSASLRPLPTKKRRPSVASTSSAPPSPLYLPPPRRLPAAALADDDRFGVEIRLQLHEGIAAAVQRRRRCKVQHETFAAAGDRLVEPSLQGGPVSDPNLRRGFELRTGRPGSDRRQPLGAFGKGAWGTRHLEHHEANPGPLGFARRRMSHDRGQLVEPTPTEPQFTVDGLAWQGFDERRRRGHRSAAAMAQHSPVPDGANTVVLLADDAERRGRPDRYRRRREAARRSLLARPAEAAHALRRTRATARLHRPEAGDDEAKRKRYRSWRWPGCAPMCATAAMVNARCAAVERLCRGIPSPERATRPGTRLERSAEAAFYNRSMPARCVSFP